MNLDVNSVASRDISSSWAAALPQFLMRRNAIAGIAPFVPRHYSSASDVSRHISVDSFNQQNLDSLSMQISEQEYVTALRHQKRKTRKERERFLKANRIAPWFPGSRRGSDTSLQSSLMAASIVAAAAKNAGMGAKVTKSTSTGDLGPQPSIANTAFLPNTFLPHHPNRTLIQRQTINPPFTHGMTDNSHRLDGRNVASALGNSNSAQRFTPIPLTQSLPNPVAGLIRPPLFGQSYDLMSGIPFGYMGGSMYPSFNGIYPGYHAPSDFGYSPYPMPFMPFGPYQGNDAVLSQYQQNLLPMHPRVDSASETEYLPIIMSDSEFTDAGHRSYDEYNLFSTQQIHQDSAPVPHLPTQNEVPHVKPVLEPQTCAKTQFLKRMGSFNSKKSIAVAQTCCPPSGRRSPHNEVPPPSPAGSSKGLDEDELDDVFEGPFDGKKGLSLTSLPQGSDKENIFQKLKSKFRRATSFTQNSKEPEALELNTKPCYSSLGHLSKVDNIKNYGIPQKELSKDKSLKLPESVSLLNGSDGHE
ncbi:hypothetical protein X975_00202, partial [Stegodyphus mimosarum]